MKKECAWYFNTLACLSLLLVLSVALSGCKSAAEAKAEHLSRGEAYLKQKKYQEASIEFRNAIQIDERFAAAHWGLAQAYEGMQRFGEAADELKRTIDLDPNQLDARVRLGNYYLGPPQKTSVMIAEAEGLADEVLRKNPNHIEAHILKANVLLLQSQPDKALAELNRAIELDQQRIESYLSLARFYGNINDQARAEETFKRAVQIKDNSALAHTEYGKFLAQQNRADEAERELRRATEVEPQNRDAYFVLANFYLLSRQNEKAEASYKSLAALETDRPENRATLADFYSTVGRFDDALDIYREITAKFPDYSRGRYRLGEIMLQRGDVQSATAQVEDVLKKNPHDTQSLLLRARIRMQTGQPRELKSAIEDLREVLKQEPESRPGLYFMAQANFRAGQYDQARAFAGDLERYYPDYPPAKLMQVQINLGAKDAKAALRLANDLLDKLAQTTPDVDTSPQLLAEVRLKTLAARGAASLILGDTKAARADFEAVRDQSPNSTSPYVSLAAVAVKENNLDEAVSFYDRALAIDNTDFDALNGLLANVYSRQNRLDQAHARVDQALSAQPSSPSLHYLKGQIYGYERNGQAAEAEFRRALESDPNYLPAYSALATLFVTQDQKDRAVAEYQRILERRPDDPATYTLIGMLEDSRGHTDAAIENYRKALDLDQYNAIAANNLAWLYAVYNKGNLDEAQRLAQGAVQRYPDTPGFADTLGWVYYKKGLHSAATEQLQKVVARESQNALYRFHLGMALAGRGDKANARRELEEAIRLGGKSNFSEADEARRTLATL